MARNADPLDSGDRFVALALDTLDHGRVALPEGFDRWGVVLFYRAHW